VPDVVGGRNASVRGSETLVSYVKDIGWLLLPGLLSPVPMVLGLASLAFIVSPHFAWWVRGNQTA
jgi:hypothetical protein